MANIIANLDQMFSAIEPWDVSNSVANLGPQAARLTWSNALKIAERHTDWLESSLTEAVEGMQEWASEAGAWDKDEIEHWSTVECLALFVQNVASELRNYLNADDGLDMSGCVQTYKFTNWDEQSGSPAGHYFRTDGVNKVEYYTGS